MRYFSAIVFLFATSAQADTRTNGHLGINVGSLTLPDGSPLNGGGVDQGPGLGVGLGVGIGMVEPERPGHPDIDTDAEDHHDAVTPFRVFNQIQPVLTPPGGGPITDHGIAVASVMIGMGFVDSDLRGVSPGALLSASAASPIQDFDDFISSIHRIATLTAPETKVINRAQGNRVL